jgi:DNA-binding response OmpR family regulator
MISTVALAVGMDPSFFNGELQALKCEGYFVVAASTTKEAACLFRDGDFDIVLIGNSIPFESRERLAALIRTNGSKIPLVFAEQKERQKLDTGILKPS